MKRAEYWCKNNTKSDILSSELRLKIPAGKAVDIMRLNKNLTLEDLRKSEEDGFLKNCYINQKLIKLPAAPEIPVRKSIVLESTLPITSRTKTAVIIEHKDNFIEDISNLSEIDQYADGFVDPMQISSENQIPEYKAVVMSPKPTEVDVPVITNAKTIINKSGKQGELVVDLIP